MICVCFGAESEATLFGEEYLKHHVSQCRFMSDPWASYNFLISPVQFFLSKVPKRVTRQHHGDLNNGCHNGDIS